MTLKTKEAIGGDAATGTGEQASEPKTRSVVSRDGTNIRYLEIGHGPGVVVMHGAMESAQSHILLARALSDTFTVYLPDRRSRTLGFPFVKDYNIQKEVEDLDALLTKTDSHDVFGVSSGAIVCLRAASVLDRIRKAGIYEPPLFLSEPAATAILTRFDDEMTRGKVNAAFITAMKGAQMGPALFRLLPRPLLEYLTGQQMKKQQRGAKEGDETMSQLAATIHYDSELVAEMSGRLGDFRNVTANVLLLGGSKSPAYLKSALDSLEGILPHVRRVEFPGLDHGGSSVPGTFNRRGDPALVARELRGFFAGP